jgi:hypothetical protein
MRLSAFDTYALYLSLKNHFTRESYDFFRYQGKTNASTDSFMKRKDRFHFQKLSRRVSGDEMQTFIVANLLVDKSWVGDLLEEEADEIYRNHVKINQSLSYVFMNELDALFSEHNPAACFRIRSDTYPLILMSFIQGSVSTQTMVILNDFVNYIQKWDSVYTDDPIWSKYRILIKKYAPFLEYDRKKLKNILKDKLKEYEHGEEQEASRTQVAQRANVA